MPHPAIGPSRYQQSNLTPFAPKGWFAVCVVSVVIFWSFQGYENVSHMAEEFKNPQRDFQLSVAISAAITNLLYILTSFATIGTAIYIQQNLYAPVALMFSKSLGVGAVAITLFLALRTSFGTMNTALESHGSFTLRPAMEACHRL